MINDFKKIKVTLANFFDFENIGSFRLLARKKKKSNYAKWDASEAQIT